MYKALHSLDGQLPFQVADYLRRHDVVYNRPALKGSEGLPLGNGKAGGLVYHSPNAILLQLNHTDAVDYAPDGNFSAWAWEAEEQHTAPFSCGQLQLTSSLPLFDWLYLEEFEERLNLAEGLLTCRAVTPFSELQYTMFFSEEHGALVMDFDLRQNEAVELAVRLEKWGSACFFHHYEQIVDTQDKNLDGTESTACAGYGTLTHIAQGSSSRLLALAEGSEYTVERLSSHALELHFAAALHHKFKLMVHVDAGDCANFHSPDALAKALRSLNSESLMQKHKAGWRAFWEKSFVHLDDDYIENLYYLHLYQMNCCSRGAQPITFGGLWTWFKDTRNWGHFYHWNHQQSYWGLLAGGHPELMQNYLEYRFSMLENARKDAKEIHGAEGAYYSDISNMNGYNAIEPDTVRNLTVGAQIAVEFYHYWRYTQDEAFLRTRTVPMVLAAFALYDSLLEKQADGYWRVRGGATCYESYWNLRETLTDHVAIHQLVDIQQELAEACGLDAAALEHLEDIRANLYPCPTQLLETKDGPRRVFAAGRDWNGEIIRYGQGDYPNSPFPATLLSPVYPFTLRHWAGFKESFEQVAENTVRYLLHHDVYVMGKLGCSGHTPSPQAAARLGFKQELPLLLAHFAQTYQCFPNGLWHYADLAGHQQWDEVDRPRVLPRNTTQTQWNKMHDKSDGRRTELDSSWFLHCYFEAESNLFAGVNEMLLDSHDGVIRVFPSYDWNREGQFVLYAAGGFRVMSELAEGDVAYIAVEAALDADCKIASPWTTGTLCLLCADKPHSFELSDGLVSFPCTKGARYLLFPAEQPLQTAYVNAYPHSINPKAKHCGKVQLGLDSVF